MMIMIMMMIMTTTTIIMMMMMIIMIIIIIIIIIIIMDSAIPADRNVVKKEAENILKYKDITETERMWNVTAKVVPVVIGASGTISESLGTGKARN